MNILVIQETDWLTRGPHIQHHIFERLSKNANFKIFVLDYDIDKIERSKSVFIKRKVYKNIRKTTRDSKVEVIRTSHLRIPFLRRISSIITNFFEILKIFRKNRPNIIVGYSISNGFIGLLISKLFNVPYVFHYIDFLHTLVPIKYVQNIARVITRIIFKFADVVIVHTDFQSKYIIDEGANPKKIRFLPIGASLENIYVDQEELNKIRENLSIKRNEFILFFMGYLYEFAGLIEIIDYYNHKVKNDHYKFKFLIVGDGGIYGDLRKYIKKIGAEWVILTGRIPFLKIAEYIQLADLCILSFKKNIITNQVTPQKIFDYMAMKKPVLSNNLSGVYQQIGVNNGVIFAKNQKALIKKIGELVNQKEKLKEIGEIGFNYVKKNHSYQKILNNFCNIMRDVLRNKKV
ncbi:MAG: glycosyltransferase [Promethearchaeota archaeon]|nr:MAG: glycosyltransferase [Candidatus Lokiarchaeota archaeon]